MTRPERRCATRLLPQRLFPAASPSSVPSGRQRLRLSASRLPSPATAAAHRPFRAEGGTVALQRGRPTSAPPCARPMGTTVGCRVGQRGSHRITTGSRAAWPYFSHVSARGRVWGLPPGGRVPLRLEPSRQPPPARFCPLHSASACEGATVARQAVGRWGCSLWPPGGASSEAVPKGAHTPHHVSGLGRGPGGRQGLPLLLRCKPGSPESRTGTQAPGRGVGKALGCSGPCWLPQ